MPISAELRSRLRTGTSVLLIGVFGLLATGCSFGSGNNAASSQVQVHIWRLNQDIDPISDALNEFHQNNPSIKLYYKNTTDEGSYELNALQSLAAKNGPEIWSVPSDWLGDHEDQTLPLPSDFFWTAGAKSGPTPADAVKSLFPPGIVSQITRADGSIAGIPTNVDTLQLYYNPALFSDATQEFISSLGDNPSDSQIRPVQTLLSTPPSTWDQLVQQAQYLTKRSGTTITRSAIALGADNNIPEPEDTLQLLMLQNGSSIVSSDRKRALFGDQQSTPSGAVIRPGQNALDFFSSFSNPSKAVYDWNPSMPQALDAFGQGKVAMVIAYSDFGQKMRVKYPELDFTVAPVPQVSTTQASVDFARYTVETVTSVTANPDAAFAVLKAYTKQDVVGQMASQAGVRSSYLTTLQSTDSSDFQSKQAIRGQSVYKKSHVQFDAAFNQMIIDVTQNGIPSGNALDTATDKINKLLVPVVPSPKLNTNG